MGRPKKQIENKDTVTMTKEELEVYVARRIEEETMVLKGQLYEAEDIIEGYETLLNMALVMRRRDDRYAKYLEKRYQDGKRYDVNWR